MTRKIVINLDSVGDAPPLSESIAGILKTVEGATDSPCFFDALAPIARQSEELTAGLTKLSDSITSLFQKSRDDLAEVLDQLPREPFRRAKQLERRAIAAQRKLGLAVLDLQWLPLKELAYALDAIERQDAAKLRDLALYLEKRPPEMAEGKNLPSLLRRIAAALVHAIETIWEYHAFLYSPELRATTHRVGCRADRSHRHRCRQRSPLARPLTPNAPPATTGRTDDHAPALVAALGESGTGGLFRAAY